MKELEQIRLRLPERALAGLVSAGPFSRMTIAGKMLVGYAVLVVLTVSIVAYVLTSLYRINRLNQEIVTIDIPAQAAADKMIEAVLAQNTYEKRYLILRKKDLRHLFWERASEFDALLIDLQRLQKVEDLALGPIEKLHIRYGDLYLIMTGLVRSGKTAEAEALSNGEMSRVVERMLELLRKIPPRARASRDERSKIINRTIRSSFRTTVVLCIISAVFSIVAGLLVTLYITSSLRRLRTASVSVAEGRFDQETGIQTGDELGDLAKSFDLMRERLVRLEEMYRDASPLTRLPGGIAIEREVQRRLDQRDLLALCVMDIDNFKSYTDRYGYAHGSEVIKETARIIEGATRIHGTGDDFIGHIGGDDFVMVTSPDRVHALCSEIIAQFDRSIPLFYNAQDRERGYIYGRTRQNEDTKFPLITISIAVVTNLHRTFGNPLEASEIAAELKEHAKTYARSIYIVDQRRT
jgi:GGDEF domain-containing protein/CHASE3 domain sensor protein